VAYPVLKRIIPTEWFLLLLTEIPFFAGVELAVGKQFVLLRPGADPMTSKFTTITTPAL
jgi:hypothetical protein